MQTFKQHIKPTIIKEALEFHKENNIPYTKCMFRYGSEKYFEYFAELNNLYKEGLISLNEDEIEIAESDLGHFAEYEGSIVPLDFIIEESPKEAPQQLNKPKRGGPKKFYVFVRDPKTKNIKKITFGDTTGLSVKYDNPERKKAFSARHNCPDKTDKTSPGYWACRINKYLGTTDAARAGYW